MKKTLLQMVLTCLLLGVLFTANQTAVKHCTSDLQATAQTTDSMEDPISLPIIMYHSILKDSAQSGPYILTPDTLANDLDYLKEHGYETVTIADLIRYVDGLADLPEKPVIITFDDGHYNNYLYAYPLLRERGMKAVISAIGTQVEQFTANGQENAYWSYLNSTRLKEMNDIGTFEVQNHSYNLHETKPRKGCVRMRGESLSDYQRMFVADTEQAQTLLIEAGLPAPTCYTYPFGAYSQESEEILKRMGFLSTLICEERVNMITRDPACLYRLGRYNRPSGISTSRFFEKIIRE